jgi:hypothetical protein
MLADEFAYFSADRCGECGDFFVRRNPNVGNGYHRDCWEAVCDIDGRYFPFCWNCDEPQTGTIEDQWPVCGDCILRLGPEHVWCGPEEWDTVLNPAAQLSFCPYNHAFWGAWEYVWQRRALPSPSQPSPAANVSVASQPMKGHE